MINWEVQKLFVERRGYFTIILQWTERDLNQNKIYPTWYTGGEPNFCNVNEYYGIGQKSMMWECDILSQFNKDT